MNRFTNINLEKDIEKGNSIPLAVQTVTIDTTSPKVFAYSQDARGLSVDAVSRIMVDSAARLRILNLLTQNDYVGEVITQVTGARSGKFKTGSKVATLQSVRKIVDAEAQKLGGNISTDISLSLVGFFAAILNEVGVIADTGRLIKLVHRSNFIMSRAALDNEVIRNAVTHALKQFDPSKIQKSSDVGVSVIAYTITTQAMTMLNYLHNVENKLSHVSTTLALVRAYVCKSYESFSKDELEFFDNPIFLGLSTNFTIVQMALDLQLERPSSSYNFWGSAVETVDSTIKSSSIYETMSLKSFREYFKFSFMNNREGLKQGFVLSKNLKESTPFEAYYKLDDDQSKVDRFWRLIKDDVTPRYLSDIYSRSSSITMSDVHDTIHDMQTRIVRMSDPLHMINIDVSQDEATLIAASFNIQLGLILAPDDLESPSICFSVDTEGSKLASEVPAFLGNHKTSSPFSALLIGGETFAGTQSVTNSSSVIGDVVGAAVIGAKYQVHDRLSKEFPLTLVGHSVKIEAKVKMEDLLMCAPLDFVKLISPTIGAQIIGTYLDLYSEQLVYATKHFKDMNFGSFKVTRALMFTEFIRPILLSTDIESMMHSAKGIIWTAIKTSKQNNSVARSMLSDQRVATELRVGLALSTLEILGFVPDGEVSKKISAALNQSGAYEHNIIK